MKLTLSIITELNLIFVVQYLCIHLKYHNPDTDDPTSSPSYTLSLTHTWGRTPDHLDSDQDMT